MNQSQLAEHIGNSCIRVIALLMIFSILSATYTYPQASKPWVAPPIASQLRNPLSGNSDILKEAKKLYATNCTPCHGNTGRGDGIAAISLNPKPADHTSAAVQQETDGSLYWKITEGRTNMPTYKQILTDNQRWELVNYIRTLARHNK